MGDRFSLLFLCAGNRFRSPLAAAFIRRLTIAMPVSVASAGTLPVGEAESLPEARELGAWSGVDLSAHRSRQLTNEHLRGVDLVLGFEQTHVRHAVVHAGADRSRTFTLGELVSLLQGLDEPGTEAPLAVGAREKVRLADALRGDAFARGDDVPDPFGGSRKVYRTTAIRIQQLSLALVAELFGVTDPQGLVLLE